MDNKKLESVAGMFDVCGSSVNGEVLDRPPEKTEGTVKNRLER